MDDLDLRNMMAEIEARRDEIRKQLRRLERWQNLAVGLILVGSGLILLAGVLR